MREILAPLAKRFSPARAGQIEHFLMLQERLGILRKTLEQLQDEKILKAVEVQMSDLQRKMDDARRSVGAYCMLYLGHTIPEESSPLWGRLESATQEKIAAHSTHGDTNLWSNLSQRTASTSSSEGQNNASG